MLAKGIEWGYYRRDKRVCRGVPLLIILLYCLAVGGGMGLTFQRIGFANQGVSSLITAFGWGMGGLTVAGQMTMWAVQIWLIHTTALIMGGDVHGDARRLMAFSGYCYLPLAAFTLVHVISTIIQLPTYIPENPDELAALFSSIQGSLWIVITRSLSQASWVAVLAGQSYAVSRVYRLSWVWSIASVLVPTALGWGVTAWIGYTLRG